MPTTSMFTVADLLEFIGTIATVIALVFAIKSFRKNTRINEAIFAQNLFEAFQRDRRAILDNPNTLEVIAEERGIEPKQLIIDSIGSFDINRAYLVYYLHQEKMTPKERWIHQKKDMQRLFIDKLIQNRWKQIKTRYPTEFQQFVKRELL